MNLEQILSNIEIATEWNELYRNYVPRFIDSAKECKDWTEWDNDVFHEFFEKPGGQCVSSLQLGYFSKAEQQKIKENWAELAPMLKNIAESQDKPLWNQYDNIGHFLKKYTKNNKRAATNRLLASLQPNLLCTVVQEEYLKELYKLLNEAGITDLSDYVDGKWAINSYNMMQYLKSNVSYDSIYDVSTYLWQIRDYLKEKKEGKSQLQNGTIQNNQNESDMSNSMNNIDADISLNQILYGPPGTGKTYNSMFKALDILGEIPVDKDGKETDKKTWFGNEDVDRDKALKIFNKYRNDERIVFTTFHQSMSYEDFIEGIKPEIETDNNEIGYLIESGIFKNICGIANENLDNSKKDTIQLSKEDAIKQLVTQYLEESQKNNTEFTKKKKQSKFYVSDGDLIDDNIERQPNTKKVIKDIVTLLCEKCSWEKEECRVTDLKSKLGISQENSYTSILLPKICQAKKKELDDIYKNKFNNNIEKEKLRNYVLVIDEINRGNVANIFGELITLIEEDKRLGNDEAITCTLPYSKEPFGVPKNLYIIGTMNTADRSVEALDTALRRRFTFEEMMPKPWLLNNVGITNIKLNDGNTDVMLSDFLYTINKRIEILKDREHQIGHSYFMKYAGQASIDAKDLKTVIYKNIIPLLQEYFYGDYEKIRMVLGDSFVHSKDVNTNMFAIDNADLSSEKTYSIANADNIDWDSALIGMKLMKYPDDAQ